jgi:homoserine kinase
VSMPQALLPAGLRAQVRVPATSANLGPAFDSAGLALALHDEVEVEVLPTGCEVHVTGEGAGRVPADEQHLVVRAFRVALDRSGSAQPGLRLVAVNRIPHGRGLGSSAAATVAGVLAAQALLDCAGLGPTLTDADVLRLAVDFEGHGDNVAACLLGGVSLVWHTGTGVQATRVPLDPAVHPVVLVPQTELSTKRARGLLPESVPHRIAAHAAGHSALLVHALRSRPDLLHAATEDRLHQPYRASAFPESMALVHRLRADGHAAVISGAGPSVLVLTTTPGTLPHVPGWRRLDLAVDTAGATATAVHSR